MKNIMKKQKQISDNRLELIFPIPIYRARRESNLDSTEKKEIEDIVKEGMHKNPDNSSSNNSYIFNTKLKKIKEFCEQHIKIYAEEIINPREELDFYITQSWLNVTKPGEGVHHHHHSNSIISGVFYISTVEDDGIVFSRPLDAIGINIKIEPKESTPFNVDSWGFDVSNLDLLLFSSSMGHAVLPNDRRLKSTTDRISISFNTFVKGPIGARESLTEVIL